MKAFERKLLICSAIHNWYTSEWFDITHTGGMFTIKKWDKVATLENDDIAQSTKVKEFRKLLNDFLTVTFPQC